VSQPNCDITISRALSTAILPTMSLSFRGRPRRQQSAASQLMDLIPSGTLDRKLRIGNDDGGEYELTFRITRHQGTVFAQNAYFAMATRHSKHMEVWGVDLTGTVRGNWFDGRCQGWYRLAGARFSQGTFLAAVSPAWEAAERGPADSAARGACAAVVTAAMTPLSLLKSSFSLTPLMLSSIEHTLLPDDIGSRVALPEASKYRAITRRTSARGARVTASAPGTGAVAPLSAAAFPC
jgi:hypothetical protein